jgi:hypothetical protein
MGKLPKEKISGISEDAGCHVWNPQILKAWPINSFYVM